MSLITEIPHFYYFYWFFILIYWFFKKIDPLTRDREGGTCVPHALRASRYDTSLAALYAATLAALTRVPRKARREPTYAYVNEAS